MIYDARIIDELLEERKSRKEKAPENNKISAFAARDLASFSSDTKAYHQFMLDLVVQQKASSSLVIGKEVKRIFVDGGFSKNSIFMNLLARVFPDVEVFAASMAQATAIGTALSIHKHWNTKSMPNDIIELKYYSTTHDLSL